MKNRKFFILAFCLAALMTLPAYFVDHLRGSTVSSLAPLWKALGKIKFFFHPSHEPDLENKRLSLENELLNNKITYLKALVEEEHQIANQIAADVITPATPKELSRHQKEILTQFNFRLYSLPALVIFRPINAWNSSLWIDKGNQDNQSFNRTVIGKNSPVVIGTSVVGVVDYVGEKQSRVRLITNCDLNLSVRVKRGSWLLAKGELAGQSQPLARAHRNYLKGIGFNYDFADDDGPGRDLRSGEPLEKNSSLQAMPLIQVGDLLVTTGFDGVFPPNLDVAIVKKIIPLKEGDYDYSIEAESTSGDLNALTLLFILPPI